MEQNINNNQNMNNNNPDAGGKTFTQDEVNRIVSERLARERDRHTAELEEREKAIKAREMVILAAEKLAEAGLPKDLTTVLKYDDEASLDEAISQLSKIRGFTAEKDEKKGRRIIPHILEKPYYEFPEPDLIKDAFRVHDMK